jgi:hypothetical protein
MTIAAGFICNNGLILATDLEITESMITRVGAKSTYFRPTKGSVVGIAGAGDHHLLAHACEIMAERVIGPTFQEMVSQARKILAEIYKQHVRPSYPSEQWSSALQLIVGVVATESNTLDYGLYVSEKTVLAQFAPYAFVGAGRELGYYLMKRMHVPDHPDALLVQQDLRQDGLNEIIHGASIAQLVPFVQQVMSEIEENVAYCGKGIKILRIPFVGDASYDKGPDDMGKPNEWLTAYMDRATLAGLVTTVKVFKKVVEAVQAAGGESASPEGLKVHLDEKLVTEIKEELNPVVLENLRKLSLRLR